MPHARPMPDFPCPTCSAPIYRDRGQSIEATGPTYAIHHCPHTKTPDPLPFVGMIECVCGLVVTVNAQAERHLFPSGVVHTAHPAPFSSIPEAGWEAHSWTWRRWYEAEEARAVGLPIPAARNRRPTTDHQGPAPASERPLGKPLTAPQQQKGRLGNAIFEPQQQ